MGEADKAAEKAQKIALYDQGFTAAIPHNRALGLRFVDFDRGCATIRLPYSEKLVGNWETGVLHGGPITALLDATSGAAVFMKMGKPIPIATLDFRIDYLKRATPGLDVLCNATCYKITRSVAFVRAVAFHAGDEDDPIANAAGSFMLNSNSKGRTVTGKSK